MVTSSCAWEHFPRAGGRAAGAALSSAHTALGQPRTALRGAQHQTPLVGVGRAAVCSLCPAEAGFANAALSGKRVWSLHCPLGRAVAECHHLCYRRVFQDDIPCARRKTFSEAIKC